MYKVEIINEYKGYNSIGEEILTKSNIKTEHEELKEIFEDLFRYPGVYVVEYEYDRKFIYLKGGYHTPLGQYPLNIDKKWGDYVINNMTKWDYKRRIKNEIA